MSHHLETKQEKTTSSCCKTQLGKRWGSRQQIDNVTRADPSGSASARKWVGELPAAMASTGRPMRYLRTPASCGQNLRYRWPGLRTWNRCLACLLVRAAALFVRLLLALCGLFAHHNQSIHLWGARQGKAFLHRRLTTFSFFFLSSSRNY